MLYEEYEAECKIIQEENEKYLKSFELELKAKGLSSKTIRKHMDNVGLYINDYLLREGALSMEEGLCDLDSFFYFFKHKCMWSTPSSVKEMAASLKKFYKCMADQGIVDTEEYKIFATDIKENVPMWQEECAEYNDDIDYDW